MPLNWDAAADRTLLLGILKTHNVSVDSEAMAEYMKKEGYPVTTSAIQNRMHKLKQMIKKSNVEEGEGEGGTPKSARKRGAKAAPEGKTPAKKSKAAKKTAKIATAEGNDNTVKQADESDGDLV